MDFLPEARSVLAILNSFEHKKTLSTLETIRNHTIWLQQGKNDQTLTQVLDQLLEGGLESCTERAYLLTKQGLARVKQFLSEGYSAVMVASE